jgi:hypothetical protein
MGSKPTLAEQAEGRIISAVMKVRMTPPVAIAHGDTDMASGIGESLIEEACRLLQRAARAEGFDIVVDLRITVY